MRLTAEYSKDKVLEDFILYGDADLHNLVSTTISKYLLGQEIKVTNKGSSYTSALVTITPADNDTTGQLGAAVASLEGQYGTLRLYYNDSNNVKTIFNNNII